MVNKTLVFSIALNGYQWLYKDFLRSHATFAEKHHYVYQAVTRPSFTTIGVECCWLKLTLLLEALESGYDTVFFVDADAYIANAAPALEHNFEKGKYLYLARSYSGRFNSGVILVRNHQDIRCWLRHLLSMRHESISDACSVGWGENGHVIKHTQRCGFVSQLDKKWNNTNDPELRDYIRHFSFGPLRKSPYLNITHKFFSRATSVCFKVNKLLEKAGLKRPHTDKLSQLTKQALEYYPIFNSVTETSSYTSPIPTLGSSNQ